MTSKYGAVLRTDPSPVLERQVAEPIRQTQSQRVTEVQQGFTSVVCSVYSTDGTNLYVGGIGTQVDVAWNAEVTDTDALHDNVTNNSRITIPAGKAGVYKIQARMVWQSIEPDDGVGITSLELYIDVNNVQKASHIFNPTQGPSSPSNRYVQLLEYQQVMNAGDFFEVRVRALGTESGEFLRGGTVDDSSAVVTRQLV